MNVTRAEALLTVVAATASPTIAFAAAPTRIGVNGDEGLAEPFYANEMGYFKRRGVDVDIAILLGGGPAIAAAVAGGDLQIGGSNVISLAQAKLRGVPISLIAAGAVFTPANETEKIVTLGGGPIRTARDLNGKVLGTPSLRSTAQLAILAWLDKNGGDVDSVQFIEVPQSTMGAALASGRIAAAAMEDPDLNAGGVQLRELGPAYSAIAPTYIITAWFATDDWLAKNSATAKNIGDAISQGGQWAMANTVAAAGVFEKYTKKKLAHIRELFAPSLTPALLQPIFDAATKYKILPARVSAQDFIWKGKA